MKDFLSNDSDFKRCEGNEIVDERESCQRKDNESERYKLSSENLSENKSFSDIFDRSVIRNKKALKHSTSGSANSSVTPNSEKRIRFSLNFELDENVEVIPGSSFATEGSQNFDSEHEDYAVSPFSDSLPNDNECLMQSPQVKKRLEIATNRSQSPENLPYADEDSITDDWRPGISEILPNSPPLQSRRPLVSSETGTICDVTSELHLADMLECDNLSFEDSFLNESLNQSPKLQPPDDQSIREEIKTDNANAQASNSCNMNPGGDSDLTEFLSLLRKDSLQNSVALTS